MLYKYNLIVTGDTVSDQYQLSSKSPAVKADFELLH